MSIQAIRTAGALVFLGVVASACQDNPTAPQPASPASPEPYRMGVTRAPKPEPPYVCYLSKRTTDGPNRYAYKHVRIEFPKWAQAPDGSTQVLRYVWMNPGEDPVAAANCRVPKTPQAVEITDRRLGVSDERRRNAPGKPADGAVTTLSDPCYVTWCPIEGIIVRPPSYWPAPEPYDPWGKGPCWINCAGGASQGGNDGGGYGWDPGTPSNDPTPCATGDAFLDNPLVEQGFAELWEASNASATALGARTEQYGWIVQTATGYRVHRLGAGNVCGADWTFAEPPEGWDAIVGFIHTHPYSLGELVPVCDEQMHIVDALPYTGVPSSFDLRASVQLGEILHRTEPLGGIILDAAGIRAFKGEDTSAQVSVARCGY